MPNIQEDIIELKNRIIKSRENHEAICKTHIDLIEACNKIEDVVEIQYNPDNSPKLDSYGEVVRITTPPKNTIFSKKNTNISEVDRRDSLSHIRDEFEAI